MLKTRPYQEKLKTEIRQCWNEGKQNVLAVAPTGSGKTVTFSSIIREHEGYSCTIAHRQEIVGQISLAVARYGVPHNVVAPDSVQRMIHKLHIRELGHSMIDARSSHVVAGVQTLIKAASAPWMKRVSLFVCDEAHHLLRANQWGQAAAMFPDARGLLVSASPIRADGLGLGRDAHGIVDAMVLSPEMRELIDMGFLTDYKIFSHPSDIDYSKVKITSSGDYSLPELRAAVHKSGTLVGDIVGMYLSKAGGKRWATFAVDIEHAKELAAAFRQQGVPADILTGKTDDLTRAATIRRLARAELKQVVSVDILGEGFDLPGLDGVSFGRKTESLALYRQQSGRPLRLAEGKEFGYIFDHVGNVIRHGLPDKYIDWRIGLRNRDRRSKPKTGEIPLRQCLNPVCLAVYERFHKVCPHCGTAPIIVSRGLPEHVDGDLQELTPDVLAELRAAIAANETMPTHPDGVIRAKLSKDFKAKMVELEALKEAISLYGGWRTSQGHSIPESQKLFFFEFGIDVGTAQTLKRTDAEELRVRVIGRLTLDNVIKA